MSYDRQRAADFALALMYLTLHEGVRAWKSISWDVLDELFERGLISDPKSKAKSVILTEEGLTRSRALFEQLLAPNAESIGSPDVGRRKSVLRLSSATARSESRTRIELARAERLLAPLCRPAPEPKVAAVLQIGYRVEGSAIVLFERRPRFQKPKEWGELPVAKLRFVKSQAIWHLYCMMRDLKWHTYEPLPKSQDVEVLIEEVRRDPTGIFWG
jgi:hypothetical protein